MAEIMKYVRLKDDEFIIFPMTMDHSDFKSFNPKSAGFCYIKPQEVKCYGESFSLSLQSMDDDSQYATAQFFGFDAMYKMIGHMI